MTPGAIIASRFVLERPLGAGGMGVVWSATSTLDQSKVALKFLRGDRPQSERVRQRFLQEAHATRKINHPGVVQIHDVVEDDEGLPVLVMDLLEGETLASRLERDGPMMADDAIRLLLPAVSAIAAAHDQRVIHRDLKPENLFLCAQADGSAELRVLDFGIAKVMRDGVDGARSGMMTSTGVVLGTPYYMAPEQIFDEGDIDERADVWSFGVILYECIAGRRPFAGPSVGHVLRMIALDEYTPLAEAAASAPAPPICDLVSRLLARERPRRPRTMRDVETLLRSILDGTYELGLPFAATVEISPVAHTLEDRPARLSSGQIGGLHTSISGTSEEASAATDASARRRRASARRGIALGALIIAATVVGVLKVRTAQAPPVEAIDARPLSTLVSAPPTQPLAPAASEPERAPNVADVVPATEGPAKGAPSAPASAPAPASSASAKVSHGAQERPREKGDAAAPSPPPSGEPSRRPGSVVDVPPF